MDPLALKFYDSTSSNEIISWSYIFWHGKVFTLVRQQIFADNRISRRSRKANDMIELASVPDPSLVQFSGDTSAAQACLSVYITPEPENVLSTSGTGRSGLPDHGRHLMLLTCLPGTRSGYVSTVRTRWEFGYVWNPSCKGVWKCLAFQPLGTGSHVRSMSGCYGVCHFVLRCWVRKGGLLQMSIKILHKMLKGYSLKC